MKRLLLAPLLLALSSPVQAEIDPKVREACLPAADFLGCVKAYTTKPSDIPSLRVIQGKTELTGNSCPNGHAYAGAGYCRRIICNGNRFRSHPDLRYKPWKCRTFFMVDWGDQSLKAVVDPKCPDREPIIGTQSSCTTQAELDKIEEAKKKKKKPLACRNGTWSPEHPQCKDSESAITSPMDMD